MCFFFFSSRRRHTRLTCDWSSDVCSSDLPALREAVGTTPAWADYRPATAPVEPALAALAGSVEVVRAVGPKRTADLARFGLTTVEDLLFHLPFRYEDRRALRPLAELRV